MELGFLPPLHGVHESNDAGEKPDGEHGDQIPLPAAHHLEMGMDIHDIGGVSQRQLQHRIEPRFRGPGIDGVRHIVRVRMVVQRRRKGGVDKLTARQIRRHESVYQRGECQESREQRHDEPEVIPERAEFPDPGRRRRPRGVATQKERQEATHADQDERSTCSAVAGVSLVDGEVCGFAVQRERAVLVVDFEAFPGSGVEPGYHAGDEGKLDD